MASKMKIRDAGFEIHLLAEHVPAEESEGACGAHRSNERKPVAYIGRRAL